MKLILNLVFLCFVSISYGFDSPLHGAKEQIIARMNAYKSGKLDFLLFNRIRSLCAIESQKFTSSIQPKDDTDERICHSQEFVNALSSFNAAVARSTEDSENDKYSVHTFLNSILVEIYKSKDVKPSMSILAEAWSESLRATPVTFETALLRTLADVICSKGAESCDQTEMLQTVHLATIAGKTDLLRRSWNLLKGSPQEKKNEFLKLFLILIPEEFKTTISTKNAINKIETYLAVQSK